MSSPPRLIFTIPEFTSSSLSPDYSDTDCLVAPSSSALLALIEPTTSSSNAAESSSSSSSLEPITSASSVESDAVVEDGTATRAPLEVTIPQFVLLRQASLNSDDNERTLASIIPAEQLRNINFFHFHAVLKQAPDDESATTTTTTTTAARAVIDNRKLAETLQTVADKYRTAGDVWRQHSYSKAASLIKNWKTPVQSVEEALRVPGIGSSIADKIGELLRTGRLRKAEYESDMDATFRTFLQVWGAGLETARQWWARGFRSIDDLRSNAHCLTQHQRTGLKYYEEFQQRIPRREVEQIGLVVSEAAKSLNPHAHVVVCGSFRRGAPTCGDVDCLVTLLDHSRLDGYLLRLVAQLHRVGLLTDDLVTVRADSDKYMGVCQIAAESGARLPHRRIDLHLVTPEHYPFALLYFTGSDHFNRSMRYWTQKKTPYSLSEQGIRLRAADGSKGGVAPGTEDIRTEEHIFQVLGIPYVPPHLRD